MDRPTIVISQHGVYMPISSGLRRISSLSELATKFGNHKIEILVAPNLSHTTNTDSNTQKPTAEEIKRVLAEKTPNVADLVWSTEKTFIFALESDFFAEFIAVLAEEKIQIAHFSSLALAVANQIAADQPAVIIFVQSDIAFLVAKINHQIYAHPVERLENLKSELGQFITDLETNSKTRIVALYDYSDRSLAGLGLVIKDLPVNFSKLKPSCVLDSQAILSAAKPNLA